jgi:hypothetical protein
MYDYPELPDFLNRKLNGFATDLPTGMTRRPSSHTKLVWPKKRNWRKIEARRREQEKREGAALVVGAFKARRGQ